jgi:DNA-binding MarR family transcriptional regulator
MYFYKMTDQTDLKISAWTKLMRASNGALQQIEAALKAASLPSLIHYDILLELERAPEAGLRLYELEEKLLLKQYGVSRLVERMGKEELITKVKSSEDGRGFRVQITPHGKTLRRRMWAIYSPAIEAAVGAKLSYEDARQFNRILDKLL